MTVLLERRCVVIVGAQRFEGLRVSFKVHKDGTSKPNSAEISISNLSESSRAAVQKKGAELVLQAGYTGSLATIFSGQVRTADHERKGANWDTRIRSGDGETAYQNATVSKSWRGGAPMAEVMGAVVDTLGLDAEHAKKAFGLVNKVLPNGFTAHGKTRNVLTSLLQGQDLSWSVQDGRVQVLGAGESTNEGAVLISPDTGLIGSPTHSTGDDFSKEVRAGQVKFRSLLQPGLRPGRLVQMRSEGVNGQLRCVNVDHSGDTHGGDWFSDVEAVPT